MANFFFLFCKSEIRVLSFSHLLLSVVSLVCFNVQKYLFYFCFYLKRNRERRGGAEPDTQRLVVHSLAICTAEGWTTDSGRRRTKCPSPALGGTYQTPELITYCLPGSALTRSWNWTSKALNSGTQIRILMFEVVSTG